MFDFQEAIKVLGFCLKDATSGLIYSKQYANCSNYEITVDVNEDDYKKSKINFGKDITYGRATTQDMHQKETFVVLECVDRLLSNGYSPKEIVLEKDYPSGRKEKGQFLDILVTKEGLPFYMIECKTYGDKYNEELRNLNANGGQLLTYYTNDRQVKAICLYSSILNNGKIIPEYKIIDTTEFDGSDKKDLYDNWNKTFSNIPLFKEPYGLNSIGITKDDLNPIQDDRTLYNRFARILRKYAVSDLTNAYNKLFNLFLCKIVDEDKLYSNQFYEIQFQWKKEDTSYDVLNRLSNLYKSGIKDYLGIDVIDYSTDKMIENIQMLSNGNKELETELLREFHEVRFIKNNEFAFIEVFNMETFKQNSLILREVVQTFQHVKIKYSDKDQFLGDFFERLLNIGIKQTEGQFFTPIPIANFIVNSIPFEKMIEDKIKKEDAKFLPYMIDYACGAGHFITEFMHRIEPILNKYKETDLKSRPQIQNYKQWANNQYAWAHEFVYGIEKDYRLTKTSKIACFLNGDGDANIITGNGLDSFDSDIFENTILYENLKEGDDYSKDHNVFDCVIANPPYSVQDFKDTLKKSNEEPYGEKNFELFEALGDNSDDIECLFVERTKQLLKEEGIAAIILKNTFLNVSGVHQKARELIIENFCIRGIVELGEGAFMATDTNTVVLFMQKRKKDEIEKIKQLIKNFNQFPKDINFNNKPKFISQFIKDTYTDISLSDYISLFKNNPSEQLKKSELYEEFLDGLLQTMENQSTKLKKAEDKQKIQQKIANYKLGKEIPELSSLIDSELKKIYVYMLNDNVNTVVISAGENKNDISDFLGYKFSKRKGNEGIKELTDKYIKELDSYTKRETINSKLYNPNNVFDITKVNYFIYQNLLNRTLSQDEITLMNAHISKMGYFRLNELFEFDALQFKFNINLKKKRKIESIYPPVRLQKIEGISIERGNGAPQGKEYFDKGVYPFIRAGNLNNINEHGVIIPDKNSFINEKAIKQYKLTPFPSGTILFPISGKSIDTDKIGILKEESYVVSHLAGIYHPNKIIRRYLYELLLSFKTSNLKSSTSEYPSIEISSIKNFKIPLLNPEILTDLINELDKQNNIVHQKSQKIQNNNKKILEYYKEVSKNIKTTVKLSDRKIFETFIGSRVLNSELEVDGKIPVYSANVTIPFGYINRLLVDNFNQPSILWGIDGDWMVNILPKDIPFYPTDHCGVIRLKDKTKITEKYLAYALKEKGFEYGFSRNKRASLDRIRMIKIPIPNIDEQKDLIAKILPLEAEIKKLQKEIDEIPAKKQAILDKYLKL